MTKYYTIVQGFLYALMRYSYRFHDRGDIFPEIVNRQNAWPVNRRLLI